MKEINGNLITLAYEGKFDIIIHGCNCFNTMGSGIAKEIRERIPEAYITDQRTIDGDINKLGNFTYVNMPTNFTVINAYTQYTYNPYDKPFNYEAFILILQKINHLYKGKSIGLPLIGAGLAGGDWNKIKEIIRHELSDLEVTIVHFNNDK